MSELSQTEHEQLMGFLADAPLYTPIEMSLALLVPVDYNPRDIDEEDFEALKISLHEDREFIKARPVLVNTWEGREGRIIGGEKRYLAAKALGWSSIHVILVKVEPTRERVWNEKDNHHQGKWNELKRKENLLILRDSGFQMETLGYTPGQIVNLTSGMTPAKPGENPDNKGTTPRAKVKQGTQITCPNCHAQFTFMAETEGDA